MEMTDGRLLWDEIQGLLGLDLTAEQRIQLLREIEERDPDRSRRRERELERLVLSQSHPDQALAFCHCKKVGVLGQLKQSDSLRPSAKRLGWLTALLLFVGWHLSLFRRGKGA